MKASEIILIMIAVLILLIFISITSMLPRYPHKMNQYELQQAIRYNLSSTVNNLGVLTTMNNLEFSENYNIISASSATKNVNLSSKQLFFSVNNLEDTFNTLGDKQRILSYKNTKKKIFSLGILCNKDANSLKVSIDDYKNNGKIEEIKDMNIGLCENKDITCCVIFPQNNN